MAARKRGKAWREAMRDGYLAGWRDAIAAGVVRIQGVDIAKEAGEEAAVRKKSARKRP